MVCLHKSQGSLKNRGQKDYNSQKQCMATRKWFAGQNQITEDLDTAVMITCIPLWLSQSRQSLVMKS